MRDRSSSTAPAEPPPDYWARTPEDLFAALRSSRAGLTAAAARGRLSRVGPNSIGAQAGESVSGLLLKQFRSPLVLILIFGAGISLFLREWVDAAIILAIILGSGLLGFYQEFRASKAVAELRSRLALKVRVLRDGKCLSLPAAGLVPGDVILLAAGNLVPGDGMILAANDFLVNEASLTGESFPVEKRPGVTGAEAPTGARTNCVFAGSSVRSGTASVLIVRTGARTEFGAIAARLGEREPETDFARGVRRFGGLLLRVMFLIVLFVLTVNQLLGRPVADSLLFAVALAVGLSPELLPAIVTVTLSAGARHLSKGGVLVRQLEAIENLGSMDILCTDKTGTITEGAAALADCLDADGRSASEVRRLAFLNAALETGIENPLDAAIVKAGKDSGLSVEGVRKIDEIPYDFMRRCLTIIFEEAEEPGSHRIVAKGAFDNIVRICDRISSGGKTCSLDEKASQQLDRFYRSRSESGFRVLAVAEKRVPAKAEYDRTDENGLIFAGFLLFVDPPKAGAARTIQDLDRLGIRIKIISGDNRFVTAHVAEQVGLDPAAMLTGEELTQMSDEALWHAAAEADLFVEIDPQQKERIVRALQHRGQVVGYLGDGINDAPALHAADVGISVDTAVDVARESADVVLLKPDLDMLRQGVEGGRRIFANTLKYISITTSANFGNMVSMALVTPFLPFLPLLPKQILLNNFLSDLPSAAIATDNVDPERLTRPQRWDVGEIGRFMVVFGLVSTCFDFAAFATLLYLFHASAIQFQTGWFVVSLLTELAVVLVLRTRRLAIRSRPGALLMAGTAIVAILTILLPLVPPIRSLFGFAPVRALQLAGLVTIVVAYVGATEAAKRWFYRNSP